MSLDVIIPKIGESVATVIIARWFVKPGDTIAEGQPVLEIDSDKASMEVPALGAGVLGELLAKEGDEVPVGATVARIVEGSAPAPAAPQAATEPAPAAGEPAKAGPGVRAHAAEAGVALAGVTGTGKGGRISTADVERAVTAASAPAATPPAARVAEPAAIPAAQVGRIERVRMTPIRRTIARRLVEAQATAAMLTTFNEVDMSAVMAMRARYQEAFVKRHGVKLGFMSVFVKAAIDALKMFPAVNAEIDGDEIVYKRFYNIGVAVSGPKGLVVPVLRDADQLSFAEVEKGIAALGEKARNNQLRPEDFEGGTFTISNGGIFGSMMSTPILNAPQVGILGMHNIIDRPVAVDGQVVIRPMMYLALTYDHRLIDGREAVSFLVRIKAAIEAPERMLFEV
jgi:2-oxoglutarate dehydrogenase E2 component (dihydrolipoamide succinyltransferase)